MSRAGRTVLAFFALAFLVVGANVFRHSLGRRPPSPARAPAEAPPQSRASLPTSIEAPKSLTHSQTRPCRS